MIDFGYRGDRPADDLIALCRNQVHAVDRAAAMNRRLLIVPTGVLALFAGHSSLTKTSTFHPSRPDRQWRPEHAEHPDDWVVNRSATIRSSSLSVGSPRLRALGSDPDRRSRPCRLGGVRASTRPAIGSSPSMGTPSAHR